MRHTAMAGDVAAARELLDRVLGKAPAPIVLDGDLNLTHDVDVAALREAMLQEESYLDFLRAEAVAADAPRDETGGFDPLGGPAGKTVA